jgi:excisionase family DNA binding protein
MNTTSSTPTRIRREATSHRDFLTVTEVAMHLGVAKTAIYGWLARGDIAYHRVGRLVRIRRADVDAYLERNRVEHRPTTRAYGRYPQA